MQITIYLFYFYHNFPRENRRWWDAAAEADLQSKPMAARPPALTDAVLFLFTLQSAE